MSKIAFVTDSTAYLTPEQAEEYQIHVVPLSVIFGEEVFQEGVDLSTEAFYSRLNSQKGLPTTSQPPIGAFAALFEELLKTHDHVMCLLLSDKLSGTLRSAQAAAEMVDASKIKVVDSGIASFGIAGPLMDGVRLARAGGTVDEVTTLWQEELDSMSAYFVLDTLEYLHRGGRIGGAAAVFGALLQIKPILTLVDGRIELFEKVRTHRRAMDRMISELDAVASKGTPLTMGVVHSSRLDDALALRDELVAKYPNIRAEVSELGPVVAAHTGPGVLALLFYETSPSVNR